MPKADDYTTESKEQIRRVNKAGEVEIWYRIYATSRGGTYFSVELPEGKLAQADAFLTARAKQLDAI